MSTKTMTVQEALNANYTICCLEGGGEIRNIRDLTQEDIKYGLYCVCENDPHKFVISESTIKDLVISYLEDQCEVGDEDGTLPELASQVPEEAFTTAADAINASLSSIEYYQPTGIELRANDTIPA